MTDCSTLEPKPPLRAWLAPALAGTVLAACGGGDAVQTPQAFAQISAATPRRRVLGEAAPAGAAATPTASEFLDWAENAFSTLFPGPQADMGEAPVVFRFYPATGNYLGVLDGRVYVLGPAAGSDTVAVDVGALADFAAHVAALKGPADDAMAARFLVQATLGATDADIAAVRSLGYRAWLDQEMARAPSTSNWQWLLSKGIDNPDNRGTAAGADAAIWQRLIGAPDTLRQRMALALSEIFVVGLDGLSGAWKQFKLAAWWDLLAANAFGNYRSLLEAVTLNVAMGQYLSTAGNQKEDALTGRQPDENYAREVMQLFSIGLYELNPDGSLRLDAAGKPIETYTQDTVTQLARVFTGWVINTDPLVDSPEAMRRPMALDASRHSTLAVNALGMTIPAGTSGTDALRMTLDTLAAHPNVGPFIGRQLIQRLVTSNPSPAYVARVAAAFADNGQGVRGDLGAVLRAVLIDAEARDPAPAAAPSFGRLRSPLVRFIAWARSFGVTSATGAWTVGNLSDPATRLGQSPLRPPSVFNWYRPGYVPPGTAIAKASLVAPEFQLANETSVAGYVNFMQIVIPGSRLDLKVDYAAEEALADQPAALVDRVALLLCGGQMSTTSRQTIVTAITAMPAATPANRSNRVYATVLLVMASPDFLVQK